MLAPDSDVDGLSKAIPISQNTDRRAMGIDTTHLNPSYDLLL
jgi:hypothetical protein